MKPRLQIAVLSCMLFPLVLAAQKKNQKPSPGTPVKSDTTAPKAPLPIPGTPSAIKSYKEVITSKAITDDGFIKVHKVEEKYYFEINDSVIDRDILVVNRISRAAAGARASFLGYAGDAIGDNVIRFSKGPSNKIFLKTISYQEMASDTSENGLFRSVLNSNLQPITAAFDVKALRTDSTGVVVDITDYIKGDNDVLFFDPAVKGQLKLTGVQADKSYIDTIKSYPFNLEIRTIKTYGRAAGVPSPMGMPSGPSGPSIATYELNSSLVLLPVKPMQPRYFDDRVGYFATQYVDFDVNPHGIKKTSMITRWKLEPKAEDIEKYKRGELVEPKEPIVFYIDPATPKKWVPYLIKGVNDWQVAFEQAGFKNAIIAKEAPKNDPDWSIDDARHNAIVYKPSDIPNAMGPHVHDPRSGEIIETHVNWYHNVMEILKNWYMVQTAAVDPRARQPKFDDSLMGQLIRFVSSHEVGHTLGLRHNFGSSSTVAVEKLRDKAWVEANGHTPSIMDYARFNYVAQPEDNISEKGLFPRIGEYDKWAIEWGYKWIPEAKSAQQEKAILNKWIVERVGKNKRLWFGTETDPNDPRCQSEDLGDNAMKAGYYGIRNLKRIMPNIITWSKEPGEGYDNAKQLYSEVFAQYSRYVGHVLKNIGGVMTTPRTSDENGNVIEFTPKAKQKEAMQFLQQQVFTTPSWLMDKEIFIKTGAGSSNSISGLQDKILGSLLSSGRIDKLFEFEAKEPAKAYTATEMINDLHKGIWSELAANKPISVNRRSLQRSYIDKLGKTVAPPAAPAAPVMPGMMMPGGGGASTSDLALILKIKLKELRSSINTTLPSVTDKMTRYHLQDCLDKIKDILEPK